VDNAHHIKGRWSKLPVLDSQKSDSKNTK
jgi:hypothetical protein